MTHLLDDHVWHALTTRCATWARRSTSAAVLDPQVGPFAALAAQTPTAWSELTDVTRAVGTDTVALFGSGLTAGPGWTVARRLPCHQMVLTGPTEPIELTADDSSRVVSIAPEDLDAVAELVALTEPGPYAPRTTELGGYVGIRVEGRLVALAGRRMQLDDPASDTTPAHGYAEISLVCVHPDHRGRGLARQVVRAVAADIRAGGDTAYLHVLTDNHAAAALYRSLGFVTRADNEAVIVRRSGP